MSTLDRVHSRSIEMIRLTLMTLEHLVQPLSRETATTLRDGANGWTVLEVVCHLRDFEKIFTERLHQTLAEEKPVWAAFDQEEMVVKGRYNEQDLAKVLAELVTAREQFIANLEGLTAEQWHRSGIHPHRGIETITDIALNTARHDVLHLEQITRILRG